jgi:2-polyprenyl-3-methyl-5-hydroxy-6-metoxy-1,4-benzoquinol methylase
MTNSDRDHFDWITTYYKKSLKGCRVLDIGCGKGDLSTELFKRGISSYVGIDLVLKEQKDSRLQFINRDLNTPHWTDSLGQFDLILAFDILEHVESPWNLVGEINKLLSDEGVLILTTPNTQSWERMLRPKTWSGVSNDDHKYLFSDYSLKFMIEKTGLKIRNLQAPIRKLGFLNKVVPRLGGQIYCEATR